MRPKIAINPAGKTGPSGPQNVNSCDNLHVFGTRSARFLWLKFRNGYTIKAMDWGTRRRDPLDGRRTIPAGSCDRFAYLSACLRVFGTETHICHGFMEACHTLASGREDLSRGRVARRCGIAQRRGRRSRWLAHFACALVMIGWSALSANALVVTNAVLDTTQPPPDDPGWNNVAGGLSPNYTYLGNGWALTAFHVARLNPLSDTIADFWHRDNYGVIPNQGYNVPNPSGMGLSAFTDLYLVRLNGDPGLPSLTIASQALTTSDLGQPHRGCDIRRHGAFRARPIRALGTATWATTE